MAMNSGFEALPAELKQQILVRFPVKSLVQFRAVCKSWKTLIDSNSFKKRHLQSAKKALLLWRDVNVRLSIWTDGNCKPSLHFLSTDSFEISPSLDYDHIVDPSFTNKTTPVIFHPDGIPMFEGFGVANGLVLLCWNKFPVVWNPLTHEFRKIDPPPILEAPEDFPTVYGEFHTIGFDPHTQDYKILFAYFSSSVKGIDCKVTCLLYSLRSNSWKIKSFGLPHVFLPLQGDGCLDGKCYWLAVQCFCKVGPAAPGIASFDFSDETFELNPLPKDLVDKVHPGNEVQFAVVTSRGCLEVIMSFKEGEGGRRCEIWGKAREGSWNRKLGVGLPSGVEIPRGVSMDGQLIFQSLSRHRMSELVTRNHFNFSREIPEINLNEVLLIDSTTGACKNIGHGACLFGVFTYVESLFSINH